MTDRLRELATEAAKNDHVDAICCRPRGGGHVDDMEVDTAEELGFATCPHPDCVLVREAATSAAATEPPTDDERVPATPRQVMAYRPVVTPVRAAPRPAVCTCRHDSVMSTDCDVHYYQPISPPAQTPRVEARRDQSAIKAKPLSHVFNLMQIRAWVDEGFARMSPHQVPVPNGYAGEAAAMVWSHIQDELRKSEPKLAVHVAAHPQEPTP